MCVCVILGGGVVCVGVLFLGGVVCVFVLGGVACVFFLGSVVCCCSWEAWCVVRHRAPAGADGRRRTPVGTSGHQWAQWAPVGAT